MRHSQQRRATVPLVPLLEINNIKSAQVHQKSFTIPKPPHNKEASKVTVLGNGIQRHDLLNLQSPVGSDWRSDREAAAK